ncbi:MAG TPA: ribosome maturation factor RimM, partial [Microlunatus sp.]|nr:ribosome maturation factor RimM [Microlunatus sp.]
GIRGEVLVDLRTDEPELRFVTGRVLRDEATGRRLTIASTRWQGNRMLVRFDELPDRTAAEQVRGVRLATDVDPAQRPDDPEEYFDRQLVGLRAEAADGSTIGTVIAVLHLPEQDLLEVDSGTARHLIPFVIAIVPEIDLAGGRLRLAPVEGLLDYDAT